MQGDHTYRLSYDIPSFNISNILDVFVGWLPWNAATGNPINFNVPVFLSSGPPQLNFIPYLNHSNTEFYNIPHGLRFSLENHMHSTIHYLNFHPTLLRLMIVTLVLGLGRIFYILCIKFFEALVLIFEGLSINDLALYIKSFTGGSAEPPSDTRPSTSEVKGNSLNGKSVVGNSKKRGVSDEGEDDENNPNKRIKNNMVICGDYTIDLKKIEELVRILTAFLQYLSRSNPDGSLM